MPGSTDKITTMRQSSYFMTFELVIVIFLVETSYAIIFLTFFLISPAVEFSKTFVYLLWALHSIKFFVLLFFLTNLVVRYLSGGYMITNRHLYVQRGILAEDEEIYDLQQVRSVVLHQTWWGKRFHYGTIRVTVGARGLEKELVFNAIANPHKYSRILKEYTAEYSETSNN